MAASTLLEAKLAEECTCSICFDLFDEPIQLPCQHSFCYDCISDYARRANSKSLKCPMCNTLHNLPKPADISVFPRNLLASSIVSHLKSQAAANNQLSSSAPNNMPNALPSGASAPDVEDVGHLPIAEGHLKRSQPMPSAPPAELFDPPPKSRSIPDAAPSSPSSSPPGFWSRLFRSSPAANGSGNASPTISPSAPPPESSGQDTNTVTLSAASPSSSSPTSQAKIPITPTPTSSNISSSSSSSSVKMPPDIRRDNEAIAPRAPNVEHTQMMQDMLKITRAAHSSKATQKPPVIMPREMMPPRRYMLAGCEPMFSPEELCMPFVVPESDIPALWTAWAKSLWFTNFEGTYLSGHTSFLVPAWRIATDLTIHYSSTASITTIEHNKRVNRRVDCSGSLEIRRYVAIVCAVSSDVPFANLMRICVLTDQLPMKTDHQPRFWQWLLGTRATPHQLEDFPAPSGAMLERDKDWFKAWEDYCQDLHNDETIKQSIAEAVATSSPALRGATINVTSATPVGFHSLTLTPLRIPMYLCHYMHPSRSTPYYFVVSGQDGAIHDGTDRPLTTFGHIMKGLFGNAFSK